MRALAFDRCEECPFHASEKGMSECYCANPSVMMQGTAAEGFTSKAGYYPKICEKVNGNMRRVERGPFPKWCPLQDGVNHVTPGRFYGHVIAAPDAEWRRVELRNRGDTDA